MAPSPIAGVRLSDLRRRHVLDFVRWLADRKATRPGPGGVRVQTDAPLSWQSRKHALALVQRCLQGAMDAELITTSPAADIRLGKREVIDDPWTWLEQKEIDQILKCDQLPEEARDLYAVAIYTGCRAGELWALCWEEIRLNDERPRIVVRRSHGGATKSGKPRTVPLLTQALAALRRIWMRAGQPQIGLVFPGRDGSRHGEGYDGGWADTVGRQGDRPGHKTQPASSGRCASTTCVTPAPAT